MNVPVKQEMSPLTVDTISSTARTIITLHMYCTWNIHHQIHPTSNFYYPTIHHRDDSSHSGWNVVGKEQKNYDNLPMHVSILGTEAVTQDHAASKHSTFPSGFIIPIEQGPVHAHWDFQVLVSWNKDLDWQHMDSSRWFTKGEKAHLRPELQQEMSEAHQHSS